MNFNLFTLDQSVEMKIILSLLFLFISYVGRSQSNFAVEINCIGIGETVEVAKSNGLRQSFVSAFNAFITIESMPSDLKSYLRYIPLLSFGIVKSYTTLETLELSDTLKCVYIKATLSIPNLIKHLEEKGASLDKEGNEYTFAIQKNYLIEQNEIHNIRKITEVSKVLFQSSFDFELKTYSPDPIESSEKISHFQQTVYVRTKSNYLAVLDVLC
jgi:hypothetical protein